MENFFILKLKHSRKQPKVKVLCVVAAKNVDEACQLTTTALGIPVTKDNVVVVAEN